jgi:hypothetical protein
MAAQGLTLEDLLRKLTDVNQEPGVRLLRSHGTSLSKLNTPSSYNPETKAYASSALAVNCAPLMVRNV